MRETVRDAGGALWGRCVVATVLAALLALPAGLFGARETALADTGQGRAAGALAISGVDYLETGTAAWELLRLDNYSGESLYLDVERTQGGQTVLLASRQKYTPGDGDGAAAGTADSAEVARIVSLDMTGLLGEDATIAAQLGDGAAHPSYAIRVHSAPRGGEVLYEGTVYPVYAELVEDDGASALKIMGIRTASAAEASVPKNLGVGATYVDTGAGEGASRATYRLVAGAVDNAFAGDSVIVRYERAADQGVTGSVRYVDPAGTVVRTDTYPGIGEGADPEPVVTVEQSFFAEDRTGEAPRSAYYRVISGVGSSVQLTVGRPHRTVRVVEVPGADAGAYQVTVRYEDEAGTLLWSDVVDVKGDGYRYMLPDTFSTRQQSGVNFYTLQGVAADRATEGDKARASSHAWGNPVVLTGDVPADAFGTDENGECTLTATYRSSDVEKRASFKLVEVDGSTGTVLGSATGEITPEGGFSYTPEPREVNGVRYVPWSGNMEPIAYKWADLARGIDLLQYVYYVPEDYVPGTGYDITVQYQNIADGSVLRRETVAVDPEANEFVEILGPERFSQDGAEYVRLAGQETAIRHAFFSPARTYTIYYRDVNDVINADTVITRTQIIETERTVTVPGAPVVTVVTATPTATAPAGGTGDGATTGAPAGAAAADAPLAGVGAGDATTVIDDDANPLATLDGQTPAAERAIEDNENPLASGVEGAEDANREGGLSGALMIGIPLGAAALAALVVFLLWRRKRQADAPGESA